MNTEQIRAVEAVKNGQNVFITGAAGTGKSFVLNNIIRWAKDKAKKQVGITASTGLAAYLIRGRTIHSFLGIGLGKKSAQELALHVRKKNKGLVTKLRLLDMLIIDEISMLTAEFLDKVSEFLKVIRESDLAFGGIQVVLCGDFAQLPSIGGDFCFEATSWKEADLDVILLKDLVRQDGDTKFQEILSELRWGKCTKETLVTLKSLMKKEFEHGVVPTRLYSRNVDVDKINIDEFSKLQGEKRKYVTKKSHHPNTDFWCQSVKIHDEIELCEGAQVMVSWNLPCDSFITNGTRGVVLECLDQGVKIRLMNGKEVLIEYMKISCEDNDSITASFVPLKLAYALSIHKSQGMTLDAIEIDVGESIFEYGQAYTALSRARTMEGVKIVSVRSKSFKTHPKVLKFYNMA